MSQGAFNNSNLNNFLFHVLRRILIQPSLIAIPVNTSLHLTNNFILCMVGADFAPVSNTHWRCTLRIQ